MTRSYEKRDGKHLVLFDKKVLAECRRKKDAVKIIEVFKQRDELLAESTFRDVYYFECDLPNANGDRRTQKGMVYARTEIDLFWCVDEVLSPYDVRITQDIIPCCIVAWEHHEKYIDEDTEDSLLKMDATEEVRVMDDALWLRFNDNKELEIAD